MNLTNEDVQEILRLLDASTFDELHLETDRFKLTLRRSSAGTDGWTQERQTLATPNVCAPPASQQESAASRESASSEKAPTDTVAVRAPIMGTFYRAPKPGAAAFVEVGSRVDADTVVGIVETMKLMNSVYAGTRGEVVEVCANNGELVDQLTTLMRVRPDRP